MENRLKELRAKRGWTQEALARRLGVSRQTVISVERGRYYPGLLLAFKMADEFGRPIEDLFRP